MSNVLLNTRCLTGADPRVPALHPFGSSIADELAFESWPVDWQTIARSALLGDRAAANSNELEEKYREGLDDGRHDGRNEKAAEKDGTFCEWLDLRVKEITAALDDPALHEVELRNLRTLFERVIREGGLD